MKFNKIFLVAALVLVVLGMGVVVAENVSLGSHEFTIPDGFKVLNSTDNMVILSQDNDHAIGVMIPESVKNSEDAKNTLKKKVTNLLVKKNILQMVKKSYSKIMNQTDTLSWHMFFLLDLTNAL